jgi:hypothetical protein
MESSIWTLISFFRDHCFEERRFMFPSHGKMCKIKNRYASPETPSQIYAACALQEKFNAIIVAGQPSTYLNRGIDIVKVHQDRLKECIVVTGIQALYRGFFEVGLRGG